MASPIPEPAQPLHGTRAEEEEASPSSGPALVGALLAVAPLAWLVQLSLSEFNPDWAAYLSIYDLGGAWLAEAGRDPAFTAIVAFSHSWLGGDGYEAWRTWLAAGFVLFSLLLVRGWVIPPLQRDTGGVAEVSVWAIAVAVTYLGCTRFTIQIREGLAIAIALVGLGLLVRRSWSEGAAEAGTAAGGWAGWALLVWASLMHLATAALLLAALAAQWAAAAASAAAQDAAEAALDGEPGLDKTGAAQEALDARLLALWALAFFVWLAASLELDTGGLVETFALDTAGERSNVQREVTLEVVGLWALYGVVGLLLLREARTCAASCADLFTQAVLRVLAGPAAFAVYAIVLTCLMLDVSTVVMTFFIRLLHLLLAVLIVILSMAGARVWLLCLLGAFLVADQLRAIVQAVSQGFGIDLF